MAEQSIPPETLKMAAVVIATVPILLVYPFLQKHFAKGVMVGSIKGNEASIRIWIRGFSFDTT